MTDPTLSQMLKGIDLLVQQGRAEHCMVDGKPGIRLLKEMAAAPCDCRDPDTVVECDHHPTEPLWVVRCRSCGWQSQHENTKAEAIATWNAEHVDGQLGRNR